ncbi:hypothetical protein PR048_010856 [Dryococelus australis]|uniref:Uncharacterized protein n=1 Tax=Dryococelus australis TaxID=614101 RepID=A0ABQ9I4Y0_9NEOP|nr:hypothetical protein PR048_010856 [Dryococelus australis]
MNKIRLTGLIKRHDVCRHRPTTPESEQFTNSCTYFATKGSDSVKVCRTTVFWLTNLSAKGIRPVDMRCIHDNRNRILKEAIIKLDAYIESYSTKTAHYMFTPIIYLEAGLTCRHIFGRQVDVCSMCEDLNIKIKSAVLKDNSNVLQ